MAGEHNLLFKYLRKPHKWLARKNKFTTQSTKTKIMTPIPIPIPINHLISNGASLLYDQQQIDENCEGHFYPLT